MPERKKNSTKFLEAPHPKVEPKKSVTKPLNRREFLKYTILSGGALALASAAAYEFLLHIQPDQPKFYTGPFKNLDGKEFLPQQDLQRLIEEMNQSEIGILIKVAEVLPQLIQGNVTLPDWVNPMTLPLKIVTDQSEVSSVTYNPNDTVALEEKASYQLVNVDLTSGQTVKHPGHMLNKHGVSMLIKLAIPERIKNDEFTQAIVLTKEVLSMLLIWSLADLYYLQLNFDVTPGNSYEHQILDLDDQLIHDIDTRKKIGQAFYMNELAKSKESLAWRMSDVLPILLIAASKGDSKLEFGKFISDFQKAWDAIFIPDSNTPITDPGTLFYQLLNFNEAWKGSPEPLITPDEISPLVDSNSQVIPIVFKLADQMYGPIN